jgi:hypothetical protein
VGTLLINTSHSSKHKSRKSKATLSPRQQWCHQLRQLSKEVWEKSWTHFLGVSKIVTGSFIATWHLIGNLVTNPEVKGAIERLELPVYVGVGLAILGCLTLMSMQHNE